MPPLVVGWTDAETPEMPAALILAASPSRVSFAGSTAMLVPPIVIDEAARPLAPRREPRAVVSELKP